MKAMIKMKFQALGFALITTLVISSCGSRKNITPAYYKRASLHEVIAVLPPETSYTGNLPKDMTEAERLLVEEAESKVFQKMLYDAIINESGPRKKDVAINILSLSKTNQVLEDSGYSIHDSWKLSPEKLCQILGVDAVVRGNLRMQRFMSDLASYGLEVGDDVIDIIRDKIPGGDRVTLPTDNPMLNRTYDIFASLEVLDGRDGVVLWGVRRQTQADWEFQPEQMIQGLSHSFANRFPYRFNY